jgi:hypothetical protein
VHGHHQLAANHTASDMDFAFTTPTLSVKLSLPPPDTISAATIKAAGDGSAQQARMVRTYQLYPVPCDYSQRMMLWWHWSWRESVQAAFLNFQTIARHAFQVVTQTCRCAAQMERMLCCPSAACSLLIPFERCQESLFHQQAHSRIPVYQYCRSTIEE